MRRIAVSLLIVTALAAAMLSIVPGCGADLKYVQEQVPALREQVEATQKNLETAKAQIEAIKEADPAADTGDAEAVVKKLEDGLAKAQQVLAAAEAVVSEAEDLADVIQKTGEAASPYVPGGFGPLVALGAATIAGVMRAVQNRNAARDIARAIEENKVDGKVDFASPSVQAQLSASMGAAAKRIVDEAQGNKSKLPL